MEESNKGWSFKQNYFYTSPRSPMTFNLFLKMRSIRPLSPNCVCTFAPSHLHTQSDILTDRVEWIPVPDTLEGHICIPKFGKIKTRRENHKGNFHETSYYREVFPLPEKEGRGGDTEGACEDCWWYGVSSLLREGVERVCWFFRRLSSTAFSNTYVFLVATTVNPYIFFSVCIT